MGNTDRIQVPVSPTPFTGQKRAAKHLCFGVTADLNMVQQIRVFHVDETGKPIHQIIDERTDLTDNEKALAKTQYPTRDVSKTTEGAWCDPATGEVVAEGTEGAVPQLDFFQALTVKQMLTMTGCTVNTSFAQVLYTMLAGEITKIDNRGGL